MRMWFELPAERSAFQGVHAMALDVILLHYQESDAYPLTVIAKRERSLDGSSPEEAVPVLAFASP